MKSLRFALTACAAAFACQAQAQSATSPELYDYFVQDVCTNAAGQVIEGDPADPATCSRRRNIEINEPAPYILTDWDTKANGGNGISYFVWGSIPVRGEDGRVRVITPKDFIPAVDENYTFSFEPATDGFDLADLTFSSYASFIRTSDGGCLDQAFSPRAAYRNIRSILASPQFRAGGWVLFPLATAPSQWPQTSAISNRTQRTVLSTPRPGCNNGGSTARTYWNAPAYYRFEGNEDGNRKRLQAIRSDHFAGTNLASQNNALERFYFTKEYGFTRWEAWVPRSRCVDEAADVPDGGLRSHCEPDRRPARTGQNEQYPEIDLRGRCQDMNVSATAHPDIDRWGGQDWVRVDCRDMTRYLPLWSPVLMLDSTIAQTNGIDDIDLTNSSSTPAPAPPPSTPPTPPPGFDFF